MAVSFVRLNVRGGIEVMRDSTQEQASVLLIRERPEEFLDLERAMRGMDNEVLVTDGTTPPAELARTLRPHLIVSDIVNERVSVLELCRELKSDASTRDIPVLLAGRSPCDDDAVCDCLEAGADDYIHIALQKKLFPYKVRQLVSQARERRELRACDVSNLALLRAMPDMMIRLYRDGRVAAVVPGPECPIDSRPEDIIGRHVTEILPADVAGSVMTHLDRALVGGDTQVFEYRLPVGGIERTREARFVVTGGDEVVAIVRDITDRVQAAEQARALELQERMMRLIENSNDIVTMIDERGAPRYHSGAMLRVLGYNPDEMTGPQALAYLRDCVHPEDLGRVLSAAASLMSVDGISAPIEFRFRHHSGDWRVLEASGNNLLKDPELCAVVVSSRDITERKEFLNGLMQSEKLSALGLMGAGVAHELNNALTPIVAYTASLLETVEGSAPREMLDTISQEADRAATIVRRLLEFSRQRPPERSLYDVNDVVRRAAELRASTLRVNNITVELALGEVPWLFIDDGQLFQVLTNIIINAEQAMMGERRAGGIAKADSIRLKTELDGSGPDERVIISIKDTGPGIPEEHINKIFDPFFTTKPVGQGTGLGLALSYGIVKQHGGEIRVESAPGVGTTFLIELPVGESDGSHSQAQRMDGT